MKARIFCVAAVSLFSAQAAFGNEGVASKAVGHWVSSGCEVRETAYGPQYLKRDFTYRKTDWEGVLQIFADKECKQKQMHLWFQGPWSVGAALKTPKGAFEAEAHFAKAKITPNNAFAVELLKKSQPGKCGKDEWKLDTEQDISETGCQSIGLDWSACPKEFDIVKVDAKTLQFGARPKDGSLLCSVEKRPTALQVALVRKK